jgi:hypothetical protein
LTTGPYTTTRSPSLRDSTAFSAIERQPVTLYHVVGWSSLEPSALRLRGVLATEKRHTGTPFWVNRISTPPLPTLPTTVA